ncbi:hypothetical protein [Streptomyces sp. DW26H14]|uniref:hypothetical protein n=1 Tax=Streptomyces sp. DW26H14 TaxID=3435395 RepID=UPI00403D6C3E
MLDITRERSFSRTYRVALDGSPVAEWSPRTWRSGGRIELAGETLDLRSTDWGRTFEMLAGGEVRALARRSGRRWHVEGEGVTYELSRPSLMRGRREVLRGGRSLGEFRRARMGSGLTADLTDVPPTLQVFMGLVVLTLWQRRDTAAVAAASSG